MKIFIGVIGLLIIYLLSSLFMEMPMPKIYEDWLDESVNERMNNDPSLKMYHTAFLIAKQRDSLQHVVDSLIKK
jgi:hypothetical protein